MTLRFDPRLRISESVAYDIEVAASELLGRVTVFLTDRYDFPLAAEIVGEEILVRAATGDEVCDLLTTGVTDENGLDWPGDPAQAIGRAMEWQKDSDGEPCTGPVCRVWTAEILLRPAGAVVGPFYVHEQAARAWAFSTALGMPEGEAFEVQVLPYGCVKRFAPGLLRGGDEEFQRLNHYWVSPVRVRGPPSLVSLPGSAEDRDRD